MTEELLVHVLTVIEGESEELVHLVELKGFVATEYHQQFDVDPKGDPEMLDRYSVGPDDVPFLEKQLKKPINFDFKRFAYFIEAARKK
jgi:hypothetical protein